MAGDGDVNLVRGSLLHGVRGQHSILAQEEPFLNNQVGHLTRLRINHDFEQPSTATVRAVDDRSNLEVEP
jgi:hypothetical protein